MGKVKLGLIGCGAISNAYLPIIKKRKDIELFASIDINEDAARTVQKKYRFRRAAKDYLEILEQIDAAIICVPNHLHTRISIDCLGHGVNVLCEKPMALNVAEANRMQLAAERSDGVLYPAYIRRFYWSSRAIRKLFTEGTLGKALHIDIEEGEEFNWPTESGFFFDRNRSGGGVLVDMGSHLVDLILWWLGRSPHVIEYSDDSFGGVEAEAELTMHFSEGLKTNLRLSRLRSLRNLFTIKFEGGEVVTHTNDYGGYSIVKDGLKKKVVGPRESHIYQYHFSQMLDDFIESVKGTVEPFVKPESVAQSIGVIESCYKQAKKLNFPWLHTDGYQ